MKARTLGWLVAAVTLAMGAGCGDDEEGHGHGQVELAISFSASPATVGTAVEIEVEATEDGAPFLPDEVHIEVNPVGSTAAPTELTVELHTDHHKATHTFSAAGTYDVTAEAHVMEGGHEEAYDRTVQLVVN